jgi:predicted DNA-binding transcriptional regulator AlpA
MDKESPSDLLKAPEAALVLGLNPNTVYEMVKEARFPPGVLIRVSPVRGIRFSRAGLTAWISRGGLAQRSEGSESALAA